MKNLVINSIRNKKITIDINFAKSKNKPLVIFSHGFKGFKDWGPFNFISNEFALSGLNFLKFNFSHNGISVNDLQNSKIDSSFDNMQQFKFDNNDIKAFSILGINVGVKWEKVTQKFKKLVKKFHPDMNNGNKKFEDKLKVITLAYTQLKNTYRNRINAEH